MTDDLLPQRLAGQVAVVTGGARGIGLGIAQRLAAEGCMVVVWDINAQTLVDSGFSAAFSAQVDVANSASVNAGVVATLEAVGRIDILVNNAGINGPVMPVWEYADEDWAKVLAVDLTGIFYCCRAVVPQMRARGYGRIVNVSSIAGKEGMAGISAYSAAKAGVIGFTKAFARELCESGVTVNAIAPVITETDLFKEMTAEHIASAKAKIPLGRFLKINEIAAMVAFIASPECSFTTGFVFDLSGGRATY
ncbi:MAG: family NAD(P)-dependent oxidoreductase [Polaromonas sp.]|nr:family NAD(P)-dependent oxidoreductase [Polaromonas sp.]